MESKESPEKKIVEGESGYSSAEEGNGESPRSVVAKKKEEWVHSQVLRIREEDLHLGEDLLNGDGFLSADKEGNSKASNESRRKRYRLDVVLLTRPILPCSPLSGKTMSAAECMGAGLSIN